MLALNDDKMMAEVKVHEQELNIQEQFEIIQDYSGQIESLQQQNAKFIQRIHELEGQLERLSGQGTQEAFAVTNIKQQMQTDIKVIEKSPALKAVESREDEVCG